MFRWQRLIRALPLAALTLPAASLAQSASPPSEGSVAPAQARRGEATFKQTCANCHATGQFVAPNYVKSWSDRPVYELFEQLRTTMPQDNPGGLSRKEYLDVVLYLFKLNGAPDGEAELSPDDSAMKATRIRLKPPAS